MRGRHYALAYAFKVIGQGRSHVVDVEVALIGIADDGAIAVVGSKDDEASLADIEDVVTGLSSVGKCRMHQGQVGALTCDGEIGRHKRLRQVSCCFLIDGTSLKHDARQSQ